MRKWKKRDTNRNRVIARRVRKRDKREIVSVRGQYVATWIKMRSGA